MANWRNTTLGSELTFQRGFDITKKAQSDGEYWVISSSGPSSKHFEAKVKGSGVLIGRKGTLGTVFFSLNDYWPHDTTLWVKDFHGNDERFAYYFLQTLRLEQYDVGASNPTLNRNHIHLLPVLYPQPSIQRRIAAVLSAYDDLIENNQRRIAILEELARSLYREWFVEFRFPGHENVEIVEREGRRVPEGWQITELGKLAREIRRGINPEDIAPETPYVGLEHIPRRSITLSDWGEAREVQSTKLRFKKGEILFGKIRPYFHKVSVAPIEGVCSSDTIVIVANDSTGFPLVLSCVSSEAFVEHATQTSQGTKMPRANWDILVKYSVPVPPSSLLAQFQHLITDIVEQTQNLMFRNRNLRRTRDLLLPRLVSGELDVSELEIVGVEEVEAAP